jgi:predicted ArsR family transcriptional regulator
VKQGEEEQWRRLALLADPVRRTVYDSLAGDVELTREQVAARAGISPGLATHHLTKLTAAGLVDKRAGVSQGREGRPPAAYRQGPAPQLPDRRPVLLVDLLTAGRPDMSKVVAAAREHGAAVTPTRGTKRSRASRAMAELGFAPVARKGALDSGACPFLARQLNEPTTACDVALGLGAGIASQLGAVQVERVVGGPCCVRLVLEAPRKKAG